MVLDLLLVIDFAFLVLNYYLAKRDIYHPAVLFCIMNLLSGILCLVARPMYDIVLHMNTFLVLVSGMLIFTIANLLCTGRYKFTIGKSKVYKQKSAVEYIVISNFWIWLFIFFELVVAYFWISYIRNVGQAYNGTSNLIDQIGIYNNLSKFSGDYFRKLGVSQSPIYTYGYPLCIAFTFFLIAVVVNNYFVTKKIEKIKVVPIIILIIISLFGGSRSFAFTILTAILCDIVIIRRRVVGKYAHVSMRTFIKISLLGCVLTIVFTSLTTVLGRTTQGGFKTFFTYLGGSVLNLDTYLQENIQYSSMWGRETFAYFYNCLGVVFHKSNLVYDLTLPFRYVNGISIGNVYTMYYQFIMDFGYLGVLPLTAIVAFYYCYNYRYLTNISSNQALVSMRLVIFSLLYNDVIMLMFSNRFFESALRIRTIRFYIWFILIWYCYKKGVFSLRIKRKK